MGEKAVLVISFEANDDQHPVEVLDAVRENLKDLPGVLVWVGIRDVADKVLDIFTI